MPPYVETVTDPSRRLRQNDKPRIYPTDGLWVFWCPSLGRFLGGENQEHVHWVANRCAVDHYGIERK